MFMKYKELLNKMKEFEFYVNKKDNYEKRLYDIIDTLEEIMCIEHKRVEEIEKQSITLQCQMCIIKALEQRIAKLEEQIEKRNTTKNKKS